MAIYIPETDGIYFQKTREYFNEVLSSYSNGNYRSAIVMLYSVAICDILFKLQELRDMFNDPIADSILREVDKMRNANDNKSKSRWEKELIDNVRNKTKLLDLEAYTNLNHLYDHRNFSAHPALNENYELITPSKETTIAHIKNTLNNILIKPPIFIKNVIDALTEDLRGKGEIYRGRYEELSTYLNNKYYCKMPESMKLTTLKALWKFCFCLPDNEDCMNNLRINRMALEILIDSIPKETSAYIRDNERFFSASYDGKCMICLVLMLSNHPEIYGVLGSEIRLQIDTYLEEHTNAKLISWFKAATPKAHIQSLQDLQNINSDLTAVKLLIQHFDDMGELPLLIDYFIDYYGKSGNYNTADNRFEVEIQPFIDRMTDVQIVRLIEVTNNNRQIYDRGAAYRANKEIVLRAKEVLGLDFDYTVYPHFKFDSEIIYGNDVKETTDATEDDGLSVYTEEPNHAD